MRTFFFLFCLTFIAFPAVACELPKDYVPIAERYEKGLMFKVTTCRGKENYLLGTMHSDSPKIRPIFNEANALLTKVKHLGLEFVEDENTPATALKYMMLPTSEANGLDTHISAEDFALAADAIAKRAGLPKQLVSRMRPWSAAIMLQMPPSQSDGVTLDKRLQQEAQSSKKEVFGLETASEQYDIFAAIPENQQLTMLNDAISQMATQDEVNARFEETYVNRDLKTLGDMADESFKTMSDVNLREYLESHLLRDRNHKMVQRMQEKLENGDNLIAIGALHLMSEEGILALLEAQGYQIEVAH